MARVPRKYEQVLRAENAEQTRRRILDAVGQRLRERADRAVSLDAIARDARVSRSTIYGAFGSRSGLFDAFVTDLWERTGLPALHRGSRLRRRPDPPPGRASRRRAG